MWKQVCRLLCNLVVGSKNLYRLCKLAFIVHMLCWGVFNAPYCIFLHVCVCVCYSELNITIGEFMAINIHEMWYKWKTMRVHTLKLIKELITGQNYIGDHFLLKINFPYIDIGTNLPFKPLSKWFSFSILLLFGKFFSCPLQRENVMIHI